MTSAGSEVYLSCTEGSGLQISCCGWAYQCPRIAICQFQFLDELEKADNLFQFQLSKYLQWEESQGHLCNQDLKHKHLCTQYNLRRNATRELQSKSCWCQYQAGLAAEAVEERGCQ